MKGRTPKTSIELKANNKKDKISNDTLRRREEIENSLLSGDELKMPNGMSKVARQEWKRIMKLYSAMDNKFLCDLDLSALRAYCEAYSVYREAEKKWVKYQMIITDGTVSQSELDHIRRVMNDQVKVILSLSEQLCLTPVGRARMGMAKKDEKRPSKLDEIFGDNEE